MVLKAKERVRIAMSHSRLHCRDDALAPHMERANMQVYGAAAAAPGRYGHHSLHSRDLMRRQCLRSVAKDKVVQTTIANPAAPYPLEQVNRQFNTQRPNQLYVPNFTYVSTWQSVVYIAFVIDVCARHIIGWRVTNSRRTDFVLDALKQALYTSQPEHNHVIIHHCNCGSQYVSIRRHSERASPKQASNLLSAAI